MQVAAARTSTRTTAKEARGAPLLASLTAAASASQRPSDQPASRLAGAASVLARKRSTFQPPSTLGPLAETQVSLAASLHL